MYFKGPVSLLLMSRALSPAFNIIMKDAPDGLSGDRINSFTATLEARLFSPGYTRNRTAHT